MKNLWFRIFYSSSCVVRAIFYIDWAHEEFHKLEEINETETEIVKNEYK